MADAKRRRNRSSAGSRSISVEARDWIRQCSIRFENNLLEMSGGLPPEPDHHEYWLLAIRAIAATFLEADTRNDHELLTGLLGQVLLERRAGTAKWSPELNRRRFELIDKDIQGDLSPAETLELAGLTQSMRDEVDAESNLPTKGAKDLHHRLLRLGGEERRP